jgi:dienelactone hydrolase
VVVLVKRERPRQAVEGVDLMCTVRWKPVAALAGLSLLWRKLEPGASGPFGHLVAAMAALAVTSPISAQQALPSACDRADPATCLYSSELAYDVGEIDGVSLTDTARDNYDLPLVIRYPVGAPGPRPVVIWHHGGNPSARGATRSEEWSRNLAAAGYVVVHPSRTLIADPTPFEAECRDNGFKVPDECAYWVTQNRYGPQNTHFLIDHLADVEALDPALAGTLDADMIVVAGHSAGTTSVLSNAGAWQRWRPAAPQYDERNDAPVAFLATGVQGPMYAGFHSGFQSPGPHNAITEHSFSGIDRPFMFITGVGDETGEPPEARVTAWLTSSPGDKALLWRGRRGRGPDPDRRDRAR